MLTASIVMGHMDISFHQSHMMCNILIYKYFVFNSATPIETGKAKKEKKEGLSKKSSAM